MITSRWLSTICWNSIPYLKDKLDNMLSRNIISFYYFIYHYKEDDEKKDHIHLFLIPNVKINTDTYLRVELEEIDPNKKEMIRPLPFRPVSKFADKYLYDLHDENYLRSKFEERKYHYKKEDFVVSDEQYFNELIHEIDYSKYTGVLKFKEAVKRGWSFEDCSANGLVPIQYYHNYKNLYQDILKTRFKKTPEGMLDTFTGEYLDKDFHNEKDTVSSDLSF